MIPADVNLLQVYIKSVDKILVCMLHWPL